MNDAGVLFLLFGYLALRKESPHMKTSLDTTSLHWPVAVYTVDWGPEGGERLPGRGGSAITQEYRPPAHMGVDIAVPGSLKSVHADVLACAAGRVASAHLGPRGWAVLLDHGDYASGYLHLSSVTVKAGQHVEAGQRLGPMGADPMDGEHIVHLHFQLAPAGITTDPAPYLREA